METELWKQNCCLPNKLFTMGPTIFELWVMETENWVIKKLNPNSLLMTHLSGHQGTSPAWVDNILFSNFMNSLSKLVSSSNWHLKKKPLCVWSSLQIYQLITEPNRNLLEWALASLKWPWFWNLDHLMNWEREKFKVFEIRLRFNQGQTVMCYLIF